jgi:hypothetical protein
LFPILAVSVIGCGNGRPAGVAAESGDNFIDLTEPAAELVQGSELKMQAHYRFPDGLPHPDTWFTFCFEVNDGKSGVCTIRKQGRELAEAGDISASTSASFLKRSAVRVRIKAQQGKSKTGPWHDVSGTVSIGS